jgi:excisionase family DNA binding protein
MKGDRTMQPNSDELITYEEACKRLNITRGALTSAIHRGRLHAIKYPGELRKYLSAKEVANYRMQPGNVQAKLAQAAQAPGKATDASQQGILQLAASMAQEIAQLARTGYIDMVASAMAGQSSILTTLLGGHGASDPKGQRLSLPM